MLTEFGGKPVAGGTLPAQIWNAFMTTADKQLKQAPQQFPPTPYIPAQEKRIVFRAGSYKLDNGYCPGTRLVAYFAGRGREQAKCYANEVSVPLVVGKTVDTASEALAEKLLRTELIGVPTKPGKHPGYVVKQEPRDGYLSANDSVGSTSPGPTPAMGCCRTSWGSASAARARASRSSRHARW